MITTLSWHSYCKTRGMSVASVHSAAEQAQVPALSAAEPL